MKYQKVLFIIISCIIFFSCSLRKGINKENEISKKIRNGYDQYLDSNYIESIKHFKQAIHMDSNCEYIYV